MKLNHPSIPSSTLCFLLDERTQLCLLLDLVTCMQSVWFFGNRVLPYIYGKGKGSGDTLCYFGGL